MTINQSYQALFEKLKDLYDLREARSITDLVFEKITDFSTTERLVHKQDELSSSQQSAWQDFSVALGKGIPVQYVLKEAWFFGMPFYVDEHVLIPRPETEELVEWILEEISETSFKILDIGTGSGCIPISLKKKKPDWDVWALDKYNGALEVAKKNTKNLHTNIHLVQQDMMRSEGMERFPAFDLIVSNPPYIPLKEKRNMASHVVEKEPNDALFVLDNDPFIFYKKILEIANEKLKPGGKVFVEINEDLGAETKALFERKLKNVILKKDLSGKDRMLCGKLTI